MPSFTLADLSNRVLDRLDQNVALYTQPEVNSAINEAIRVLNLACGFLQVTVLIAGSSVANRFWYDVPFGPGNIVIPLRVQYEQTYLRKYNLNEIGRAYPQWLTETTATTGQPVQHFIPFGIRKFAIHPADAVGGGDLSVTGVQEPIPLVNPTDVVQWPNEVTPAFDALAAHTLMLKEGGAIFSAATADYQQYIRIMKKLTIWKGMVWPSWFVPEGQQVR